MSTDFHGIRYPGILGTLSFPLYASDKLNMIAEAKSGRAVPVPGLTGKALLLVEARIAIMSNWGLYNNSSLRIRQDELTGSQAFNFIASGDILFMSCRTEGQAIVQDYLLAARGAGTLAGLWTAIGYLFYALHDPINVLYANEITTHLAQLRSSLPPESAVCPRCEETLNPRTDSVMRFHNYRMELSESGSRYYHTNCIHGHYVFSDREGCWIHNEDAVSVEGVIGCVSESWANDNASQDEDSGEYYLRSARRGTLAPLNYSANPLDFHPWDGRNASNALVFGVELEMEPTRGNSQSTLCKLLGVQGDGSTFILKSDGSLTEGVELVTTPLTLDQHKDPNGVMPWAKVLNKVNAESRAKSGKGTEHCGIHIHINKKALSALTIGKMLVFLNSETLSPLISIIAQRGSGSYCKRDSKKKIIDGGVTRGADRYDIMNISVNHPTCEVRMFKGNLRPERVLKNIEFCHALVMYCRQTSMQDLSDWGNFSRWLLQNRGVYDNLVQFLIDKNAVGFRQAKRESNEFHTYAEIEEV